MAAHVRTVAIPEVDRRELQRRARSKSAPARKVERARIVLLAADGVPGKQIAARVWAAPSRRWSPGDGATPSRRCPVSRITRGRERPPRCRMPCAIGCWGTLTEPPSDSPSRIERGGR